MLSRLVLLLLVLLPFGLSLADQTGPTKPFPVPKPQVSGLTPEVVFNVLVGEVAAHRHRLEDAFRYTREAAEHTGDAKLAERSARLALFNKDQKALQEVVRFWVERDPNSLDARRFALSVALEMGDEAEIRRQFDDLVTLASAQGEDGFILVARALSKGKESQQALALMESLVRRHVGERDAWYAYALLAAEYKDYARAEKGLQEVFKLASGWDKAILLKVQIQLGQERDEQAVQLLREEVAAAPDNSELRHAFARLLVQSEQYQEAYDQYLQLLKKEPDGLLLRYPLGVLAMELEKYDQAEEHFQQIKDSQTRRNEASYYLGRIAEQRNDLSRAVDWYRRVLGSEFQLQAQIKVADLLSKQGRMQQARAELESARGQWPDHAVAIYVAETVLLKEQNASADEIWALFEQALMDYPDNIDLLYARALFAAGLRQVERLEQDLRRVLEQDPEHADALNALGYTLADMTDRHQEALGYIRQALDLKPDSPAILDSMGWVKYRLGELDQALEYLRQAAQKVTDPEISAHLGEVLWVSGDQDQARQVWQEAWQRFPDHPILRSTLERLGVDLP